MKSEVFLCSRRALACTEALTGKCYEAATMTLYIEFDIESERENIGIETFI